MKGISLLAALFVGVLASGLLAAEDPNAPYLREAIPYEIAGPEDANSVFTITVSDEVLYQLFK